MRGYVVRVMLLGKAYTPPRKVEVITPKGKLTDLILSIGRLPERSGFWDLFYVDGEFEHPLSYNSDFVFEGEHASLSGSRVSIKYVLMHGSIVFTDAGYTLYQRFGDIPEDIPF